ncbi:MAG: fibronectin type III domain-containing protein, partial [Thermoguttaceae bacterium]|nr:fibronectin type III domain-containing protein [Thermoguttaceae bacterium]
MSIADFFFGRKQNSNNNRRAKSKRSPRALSMEPLENRELLSVSTYTGNLDYYTDIRSLNPGINAPADQSVIDAMTIDCDINDLKTAVGEASESTTPASTPAQISNTASAIAYFSNAENLSLNVDSTPIDSVVELIDVTSNGVLENLNAGNGFSDLTPLEALDTPEELTATVNGKVINLSWNEVSGATSYTLAYQLYGTSGWTTIPDIQTNEYSFQNGSAGESYNFRVKALGTDGTSSSYCTAITATSGIPVTKVTFYTDPSEIGNAIVPQVGDVINTKITPNDAPVTYQWTCSDIDGVISTNSSLTVTEAYLGKTISCTATAVTGGDYFGHARTSVTVPKIVLDPPTNLILTPEAGENDTYHVTVTWNPGENNGNGHASGYTAEYQVKGSGENNWLSLDTQVTDQGTEYFFTGESEKEYTVRVKANQSDKYSDSEYVSQSIALNVSLTDLSLSTNNPVVGHYITAAVSPEGAEATYQWIVGNTVIDNSQSEDPAVFLVTEAYKNQKITCIANGINGYTGTRQATTEFPVVAEEQLNELTGLTVTVVGTTVSASWTDENNTAPNSVSGYTLEYQVKDSDIWTIISNIQNTKYSFVGVEGTTYDVRVKANGTGNYSDSDYIEKDSVYVPIQLTSLNITGQLTQNSILIAKFEPSDNSNLSATYEWYRGDEPITGATGRSYQIQFDDIGKTITCIATADESTGCIGTVSASVTIPLLDLSKPTNVTATAVGTEIK